MNFFRWFLAIGLSLFSTSVMSYISMVVPIGPWIETTLVLAAMIILNIYSKALTVKNETETLGLSTAAGGIGGILATGFGFSFPMLYFIDKDLFDYWLSYPLYFAFICSLLAFSAGSLGLLVAHLFEDDLIEKKKFEFPIGSLVYKMIAIQNQFIKTIQLAVGFIATQLALYVRSFSGMIPYGITLFNKKSLGIFSVPYLNIELDTVPMLISIGFITGQVIAMPLAIGLAVKYIILEPIYNIYSNFELVQSFIGSSSKIGFSDFSIAFSTGIVLYGTIIGFLSFPRFVRTVRKSLFGNKNDADKNMLDNDSSKEDLNNIYSIKDINTYNWLNWFKDIPVFQVAAFLISCFFLLNYFEFSVLAQVYLVIFTFICAYQLSEIAGKIGLAPLGRFATFVMVPGLILFGYGPAQVTVVSVFVEVAGGVACDALFGRKLARLANINRNKIIYYQWLGLVVSAISIGFILWLLIGHFGLGLDSGLPVQKALSRALIFNISNFNIIVMFIGLLVGAFVSFMGVNPALMLGGLLMPANYSFVLIVGGMLSYIIKNKEDFYPFFSGVFASNSLWMLIKAFF